MCVNDTLPPRVRPRWLFKIWRLTSRSFAGTVRTDVAVGTSRLASMLSTTRAGAPRSGCGCSPSRTTGARPLPRGAGFAGAGAVAGVGVGADAGVGAGGDAGAAGAGWGAVVGAACAGPLRGT